MSDFTTPEMFKIKKIHPEAKVPTYQTSGSSGADLYAVENVDLLPGEWETIKTGLSFEMSPGLEVQIRPRSGLAFKHGVTVLNTPGTIDSDYRGELKVILINHSPDVFRVSVGDRIAQMVLSKVYRRNFEIVDEISATERGAGGFGSTGRN
ncbi:MAG: dUTP diphosphatase [Candidatus Altiarchaeales archaeon]|nr:dUTP diphosphatase [Candidatus Altiarchaeales archaeon]